MSIDIRLARIDDRLIHGQVATAWSKQTGIERILVVSDEVAQDQLRRFLLQEASPPGIKSNVISVDKMIALYHEDLLAGQKVMLLFTDPHAVARLVQGGVKLTSINIGGMRFTVGKKMLTNFVSLDQGDIKAFEYLAQQDIELELRKVPADRKVYLMELLEKENFV
ncbi:PTS system mannose/fructose/sorbose-specific IIB component [Enterococcus dispar ATCC 51266]|jgi:PTS system mannose-specific IIB component|uniref:PTS system mannose/fructose/sorbose-specific IIB component n=1 Tax=Enterococcus dispar ATCC 51266 TaxID=1139219 RepID=S0K981_9ENTE|nr:PTS system mannose/fructose/sorbose-specific IIB component [Enterococcus dispar ATCC 51266]EOW87164.1 PTS system mannose/fructose/sorbose-specific IIB component [Enterococcus dispar ATCC 51266]OJG38357.1 PTS system mannose/fructose/sorbose-specific IIB component [Enterococcus dispar]